MGVCSVASKRAAGSGMGGPNRAGCGGDNPAVIKVVKVGCRVDGYQLKFAISLI